MRQSLTLLFFVFIFFSAPASALEPQDALSARADNAAYLTARIDDLNGILQSVFSMSNIEALASMAEPEEAQTIRILASMAAQIPAKSVAIAAGLAADETPFMQVAVSMPASARSKLDRIAEGKATGVDLITLLVGEAGLMFAAGLQPVVQEGPKGPYYSLGQITLTAKEDLLVAALSSADLNASLDALEKAENRLNFKRRFDSPNYYAFNVDMPTLAMLVQQTDEAIDTEFDPEKVSSLFKAPLKFEMGFDARPDSFLISMGINFMEAVSDKYTSYLKDMQPASVNLFLAGGGKLFLALANPIYVKAEHFKFDPKAAEVWDKMIKELGKRGITEEDIEDLLTGSFSLALGSEATILGSKAPGGYVALSGRDGAAARILGKILEDERIAQAAPLEPIETEGWDSLFKVDPALFPASLVVGVSEDKNTLFLGVVEAAAISRKPEFPAQGASLFGEEFLGGGFIDTAALWEYLKGEAANPASQIGALLASEPKGEIVKGLLDAELSVPFIKVWASELDSAFMEFKLTDVPMEKGLLMQLIKTAEALKGAEIEDEDEQIEMYEQEDADEGEDAGEGFIEENAIEENASEEDAIE